MSQMSQADKDGTIILGGFPQIAKELVVKSVPAQVTPLCEEHVEQSPLGQLHANIQQLEDLQNRLGFMMSDLTHLLK